MKSIKTLASLLLVVLCALWLCHKGYAEQPLDFTLEEEAWIRENPLVTSSILSDWAPFEFINERGEPQGYSAEYLRLLCLNAGLEVRFIPHKSWNTYLQMIRQGDLDIINSVVLTPEREKYINFTDSFFLSRPGLAVSTTFPSETMTLKELTLKTDTEAPVAFPEGFYYEEYFTKHDPNMPFAALPSTVDALKSVVFNESFAALGDRPVLEHLIRKYNLKNIKIIPLHEASQFNTALRVGVSARKPLLHSILEKSSRTITAEDRRMLNQRWMGDSATNSRALGLTMEEELYLMTKEAITFTTDPGWKPLAYINEKGEHAGVVSDYIHLLSRKLNIPFRLIPSKTWEESWNIYIRGGSDLSAALMPTEERLQYSYFTDPYLEDPFVITLRKGAPYVSSMKTILDKPIGAVANYATEEILLSEYPSINLVRVENIEKGLRKVSSKELYAFVDSLATTSYMLGKHRLLDLKIAGQLNRAWDISFGVSKNAPELVSILNKALKSITPEEQQRIWEKWILVSYEQADNRRLIRNILLAFGAVSLLGLWRYLLVHKKNAQLKYLNRQLEILSITDPLTGVYNRLKMDRVLAEEIHHACIEKIPLTIIMVDIDHFKQINDQWGHNVGDEMLKKITKTLKANIRKIDILGRWGGEEFLIISPETSAEAGRILAERLREKIENASYAPVSRVTVSLGGTIWQSKDTPASIVGRADKELYKAKASGRNRVSFPEPSTTQPNITVYPWQEPAFSGPALAHGEHVTWSYSTAPLLRYRSMF